MTRNNRLNTIRLVLVISIVCSLILVSSPRVRARSDQTVTPEYQFNLFMARGKLSVSDSYYETAIKNFRMALDISRDSAQARDWLEKAITLKKLGIINEAAESG
ncbi:MAG: hypothetical protein ACMUIS_12810 [bacterium]